MGGEGSKPPCFSLMEGKMKAIVSTETKHYTQEIEKGGLFRKAKTAERTHFLVSMSVEFTEEERAILTKNNLWDTPILTDEVPLNPPPELAAWMRQRGDTSTTLIITTTIKDLAAPPNPEKPFHGSRKAFDSPVEALNFETELKKKHLPSIKRLMEASQASLGKSETLEF
jgi:hypothetical protein